MTVMRERMQGTVCEFDSQRGLGIIEAEGGIRITVRYSAIQGQGLRNLHQGERVSFEVEHGRRGLNAVNVVRA